MTPESTEKAPRQKRPDSEEREEDFSGSSDAAEHFKLRDGAAAVEHFKLRDGAEHDIVELEKRYETVQPAPATKMTTEDKVADMATAMKQMLVENAAANAVTQDLLTQLIQLQMQQSTEKPNKRTDTETETDTETKTETNRKPNTAPNTETDRKQNSTAELTALERKGVIHRPEKPTAHGTHVPKTSLFIELEHEFSLNYTDQRQYVNTGQRRTTDFFSLYVYCRNNDQGKVFTQLEGLHTEQLTSVAYKAQMEMIKESLKNFTNPTEHTRMMIILRALIFSDDDTTQARSAKMVKAYLATPDAAVKALNKHVMQQGSPPMVPGSDELHEINDMPGLQRLTCIGNPEYYRQCLATLYDMVVECNARIHVLGLDTTAAYSEYKATEAGSSYASTSVNEQMAWTTLCQKYGNNTPMTDYDRIQFLLGLCEEYQGHEKTRRALLKYLRTTEYTVTTVPFEMAEQIMETNAMAEDELQAQLAPTEKQIKTENVSAVGAVPT